MFKNVQIIDGALNCTYSIFAFTEEEFRMVFPNPDQDIEFIEDVIDRVGEDYLIEAFVDVWSRPVEKSQAAGIQGTLFYQMLDRKKFFPDKINSKAIEHGDLD